MDNLFITAISEQCPDFLAGMTRDAQCFFGIVVGQAACDVAAVFTNTGDDSTAFKFPEYTLDAYRQQALASGAQRPDCAAIQHQLPGNLQMIGQPLLARCQGEVWGSK